MYTNKMARAVQMKANMPAAQHESPSRVPTPYLVRLNLSGSVFVDYDLTMADETGLEQRLEIRVQFPDEVRSLLETMSWRGGVRMTEKLSEIGASYVLRLFADGNLGTPRRLTAETAPRVPSSRVMTVHPSLEYVRACLVTLPTPV